MKKIILFTFLVFFSAMQLQATIRYVKPVSSGSGNGSSWANASSDLSAMLLASVNGDEVWVAAGTYNPSKDPLGNASPADPRDKTFFIPEGVKLYGGFAGSETLLSQRNISVNPTILDGDIGTPGINTDNCYHVVLAIFQAGSNRNITIDGFTVKNGKADNSGSIDVLGVSVSRNSGAGIIFQNGASTSTINIANNTISNNVCNIDGGGIYIQSNGSSNLDNNHIQFCTSGYFGGGVSIRDGNNLLTGNNISNNTNTIISSSAGGGVHILSAISVSMSGNVFSTNSNSLGKGGGLTIQYSRQVSLSNDTFSANSAGEGGGISLVNCNSITASFINLSSNTASFSGGGFNISAIYDCTLKNIVAMMNSAGTDGGGGKVDAPDCNFYRSSFFMNNAAGRGGGVYLNGTGPLKFFKRNGLADNSAAEGGSVYCQNKWLIDSNIVTSNSAAVSSGSSAIYIKSNNNIVSNNTINGNNATAAGGGITIAGDNNMVKFNTILNNTAAGYGGGIYISGTHDTVTCNTLHGNSGLKGGGIAIQSIGTNFIVNNTITGNMSSNGGGIYIENGTHKIYNNIFWINKKAGSSTVPGSDYERTAGGADAAIFKNNLLQLTATNYTNTGTGIYDIGTTASDNIHNTDPVFADINNIAGPDNTYRTADDGLLQKCGSPAVNTGNNSLVPAGITNDITGSTRIKGGTVDIGAYEINVRVYVNYTSFIQTSTFGIGSSWALAYPSLSDALEAVRQCSSTIEIWVARGIYKPTLAYPGNSSPVDARDKTFYIPGNVKIFGGFEGLETALNQRDYINNETILSGDIGTANNSSDNCYHVVSASASNATIDGFTIRDGNANGTGTVLIGTNAVPKNCGGGILLYQGNNTARNNIITANNATIGGGIFSNGATNTISGNFIYGNGSGLRGGGMSSESSNDQVVNNLFWNNTSSNGAGGLFIFQSNNTLAGNTFFSNASVNNGGAVFALDGFGQFSNNIFWKNTKGGSATVQGADYFRNSSDPNNNVFRNNLMQLTSGNYSTSGSGNFDLSNTAAGNIFATDPLYKLPANATGPDAKFRTPDDGLIPDACSPVINTGNNALIPAGLTTDILNNARIQLTTVDMGAYEAAGNTANQTALIVSSNMTVTKTQAASTVYTNDCSSLVALINSSGFNPISGSTTASVWIESNPPNSFVKRHYEITPAANAATATGRITLYFTQQEFTDFNTTNVIKLPVDAADAANNKANLRIEKRSGTSNNGTGLPGTYTGSITVIDPADADIVWNSAGNRWEVSFDVTGFSGFFVKTTSVTLPVNWISFSGSLNTNKQALLKWNVEEHNVLNYQVEKSTDGISFAATGNLNGMGDGNHSYSFTDATPLPGRAWYRIRQQDRDGRFSYSAVIMLYTGNNATLSVYPNPFSDRIQIQSSTKQTLLLQDISGRIIKSFTVNAGTTSISPEQIAKGIYILKTTDGASIKLVKN